MKIPQPVTDALNRYDECMKDPSAYMREKGLAPFEVGAEVVAAIEQALDEAAFQGAAHGSGVNMQKWGRA